MIGCDFLIVLTSWSLCFPKINRNSTMNDTFWTDTLALAGKTEVQNIFINVLATGLFGWYTSQKLVCYSWWWQISISNGFIAILWLLIWCWLDRLRRTICVTSSNGSLRKLRRWNQLFELSDALCVKRSPLVAKLTNDTLR